MLITVQHLKGNCCAGFHLGRSQTTNMSVWVLHHQAEVLGNKLEMKYDFNDLCRTGLEWKLKPSETAYRSTRSTAMCGRYPWLRSTCSFPGLEGIIAPTDWTSSWLSLWSDQEEPLPNIDYPTIIGDYTYQHGNDGTVWQLMIVDEYMNINWVLAGVFV